MPKAAQVRKLRKSAVAKTAKATTAALDGQAAAVGAAMQLPQEWAKFCAARMQSDVETMQALGRCRSFVDVMTVWTDATQGAVRDYRNGMSRIMAASMSGPTQMMRAAE